MCRQSSFASFPEVLVVHVKKFQLVNWVPTKLGTDVRLLSWLMCDSVSCRYPDHLAA